MPRRTLLEKLRRSFRLNPNDCHLFLSEGLLATIYVLLSPLHLYIFTLDVVGRQESEPY